jgi:hypothetical protein
LIAAENLLTCGGRLPAEVLAADHALSGRLSIQAAYTTHLLVTLMVTDDSARNHLGWLHPTSHYRSDQHKQAILTLSGMAWQGVAGTTDL